MGRNALLCFAHGQDDDWQAICVDLDIAVHGSSEEEVRRLLGDAIRTYIQDANREAPAVRERLLNRRAPWTVRAALAVRVLRHVLRRRGVNDEMQASFDLPCAA